MTLLDLSPALDMKLMTQPAMPPSFPPNTQSIAGWLSSTRCWKTRWCPTCHWSLLTNKAQLCRSSADVAIGTPKTGWHLSLPCRQQPWQIALEKTFVDEEPKPTTDSLSLKRAAQFIVPKAKIEHYARHFILPATPAVKHIFTSFQSTDIATASYMSSS